MAPSPRRPRKTDLAAGQAWKAFSQTEGGKAAIADLMVWCNVYSPIEATDPIQLAMMTGERNVAMRIVYLMGLRPDEFITQANDDTDFLDRMIQSR